MKNENKELNLDDLIRELNLDELIDANGGFKDDTIEMIKRMLKEQGIPYNEQTIQQIIDQKKQRNPIRGPYDTTRPGGLVKK